MGDSTTVEIGDTEVQVEETDDGFEVTEATEADSGGPFLEFWSTSGTEDGGGYGGKVPVGADVKIEIIEGTEINKYEMAWYAYDDVDDERVKNGKDVFLDEGYDRSARIDTMRVVDE